VRARKCYAQNLRKVRHSCDSLEKPSPLYWSTIKRDVHIPADSPIQGIHGRVDRRATAVTACGFAGGFAHCYGRVVERQAETVWWNERRRRAGAADVADERGELCPEVTKSKRRRRRQLL
jgi:hypothetical protein